MIGSLYAMGYVIIRGARGMAQSPLVQLLAVATMAVCMSLLGLILLVWINVEGITQSWGVDIPVTVYLVDDADDDAVSRLAERLEALPEVEAIEGVSPAMAMQRLSEGLGDDQSLLVGVDASVLPASLEVVLAPNTPPEFSVALADRLLQSEVVQEVGVTGAWIDKVRAMLATVQELAVGAGILVSLACMAIVWNTIRLGVYARRAEIQILRLVGGTTRFVRGPFIVEGMVQGTFGALMALALLYGGFTALAPFLESGLSLVFASGALKFFSPTVAALGVGFGAVVGIAGSRAAVARYMEV